MLDRCYSGNNRYAEPAADEAGHLGDNQGGDHEVDIPALEHLQRPVMMSITGVGGSVERDGQHGPTRHEVWFPCPPTSAVPTSPEIGEWQLTRTFAGAAQPLLERLPHDFGHGRSVALRHALDSCGQFFRQANRYSLHTCVAEPGSATGT